MKRPIFVQSLPDYHLRVAYNDGVDGCVDLSRFAGKGPFVAWNDPEFYQRVEIGPQCQIRWSDEIEFCSDAIYMQITGLTPEQYFSIQFLESAHA